MQWSLSQGGSSVAATFAFHSFQRHFLHALAALPMPSLALKLPVKLLSRHGGEQHCQSARAGREQVARVAAWLRGMPSHLPHPWKASA